MRVEGKQRGRLTPDNWLWESSKRFNLGAKHGRFSGISEMRLLDRLRMASPSYSSSEDVIFSHSMGRLALAMLSLSWSLVMGVASLSEGSSSVEVGDSVESVR